MVTDIGANQAQYGNQGILLNSDALKQALFGPIDGPPRNTSQVGHAGMTSLWKTIVKVGIFGTVMVLLTIALFAIFGQYRSGSTNGYSAVFADASSLKSGDSVRVAGVRVGTVKNVSLQPDNKVVVGFDADRDIVLTSGTKAAVRYLNLVGDRYLELVDSPGSAKIQPPGSQIPADRTEAGSGSRPAAGRAETRCPGTQSAGRQRADQLADPDSPGPGRQLGVAVRQDVVVHQLRWPTTARPFSS